MHTSTEQFREPVPELESDTESEGDLTEGEDVDEEHADDFELVSHPEDEEGISRQTVSGNNPGK